MKPQLLFFILLSIGLNAHSQFNESRFRPGAKIGFNISRFTRDIDVFDRPVEPYSSFKNSLRGSFTGGVTLDFKMDKKFTFGMELLYNSRGMDYSQVNDRVIIETEDGTTKKAYNNYTYMVDYLELPLTINYNFKPETSKNSFISYAGIAPAMLVNKKTKLTYPKSDPDNENQKGDLLYVNSFVKSFLAGIQFGESYPDTYLYLDLRGNYTLSRIFNRPVNDVSKNLDTRMFTFTFSFGIKF